MAMAVAAVDVYITAAPKCLSTLYQLYLVFIHVVIFVSSTRGRSAGWAFVGKGRRRCWVYFRNATLLSVALICTRVEGVCESAFMVSSYRICWASLVRCHMKKNRGRPCGVEMRQANLVVGRGVSCARAQVSACVVRVAYST